MSTKMGSKIMYLKTTKDAVKRIFYRAALIKDKNLSIRTYIPTEAFDRKVRLDAILEEFRNSRQGTRTQIRLGEKDFDVYVKVKPIHEYETWTHLPSNEIPGWETLPPILAPLEDEVKGNSVDEESDRDKRKHSPEEDLVRKKPREIENPFDMEEELSPAMALELTRRETARLYNIDTRSTPGTGRSPSISTQTSPSINSKKEDSGAP